MKLLPMPETSLCRRAGYLAIAVAVLVVLAWVETAYEASLRRRAFFDGWILFGCVLFLVCISVRKYFPARSLGSVHRWTQVHAYVGFFTVGVFLIHTNFRLPMGRLETGLWMAFMIVTISGLVGLYLSRAVPARLARLREPVLLESIPRLRHQLAREMAATVERSMPEEERGPIATLYNRTLIPFMRSPSGFFGHLRGTCSKFAAIREDIDRLERVVDTAGRKCLAQIRQHAHRKNELDFQRAHLLTLRLWLFIHIPATYSLIVLAVLHVIAVYGFSSGAP